MADTNSDFDFVAASALRAARSQRAAWTAVLEDEALSRAHGLARHLDATYAAIEGRVAARQAAFPGALDEAVRADAVVEMRRLTLQTREFQSTLAWLDASRNPPLDLGTQYYVQDIAHKLVSAEAEVTVVATGDRSYATTSNPFEPLIRGWGGESLDGRPPVVVVLIPRRERQSGLLHPLIIHELGHAADSARGLVDSIWAKARTRKRLARRFSQAASAVAANHNSDPHEATEHVAERLRSWIAECLCDAIAVHQLGPTYLYSFMAEVIASSLDEPGPRHPPPRQRVRHILTQLDRLGWSDVMSAADPKLEGWIRELAGFKPAYSGAAQFLGWAIDDLHAVVRDAAAAVVGKPAFGPEPAELEEVKRLLAKRIPPAQFHSGLAVPRESIILSCWHAALSREGGGPEALATAPDAEELAAILPAALELSALVGAWT